MLSFMICQSSELYFTLTHLIYSLDVYLAYYVCLVVIFHLFHLILTFLWIACLLYLTHLSISHVRIDPCSIPKSHMLHIGSWLNPELRVLSVQFLLTMVFFFQVLLFLHQPKHRLEGKLTILNCFLL